MKKKSVTAVEVVPKKGAIQKSVERDTLACRVIALHTEAKRFAALAVYCAAAAGATMLMRKREMLHGEFGEWLEQFGAEDCMGLTARTCQKYMRLALEMTERIKGLPKNEPAGSFLPEAVSKRDPDEAILEGLSRLDPFKAKDIQVQRLVDLIGKVTEGLSLRQLYFDWGIVQKPQEGTPTGKPELMPPRNPMLEAQTDWKPLLKSLYDHGITRKDWQHLPHEEMIQAHGILKLVLDEMTPVIRELKRPGGKA